MGRSVFNNRLEVERAIRSLRNRLSLQNQSNLDLIINSLNGFLRNRSSRFDAPDSKKWFTVKLIPSKAILAFRSRRGALEFDIDTYPELGIDITVDLRFFRVRSRRGKPNKVYVADVTDQTPNETIRYYISTMEAAIDLFENQD